MLKIENTEVTGWKAAIRGMRNPMNSWAKSDSFNTFIYDESTDMEAEAETFIGENDHDLMMRLSKAGTEHAKFMRYINVTVDLVAPLYFYKELDTYRIGVEHNSCSTMHKIQSKIFELDDFSHEHLETQFALPALHNTIFAMNYYRELYLQEKNKEYWWQMIQLLPTSYNQRRTYQFSYQALQAIYRQRKGHKLDEWHVFRAWIEGLPYSELITGGNYEL